MPLDARPAFAVDAAVAWLTINPASQRVLRGGDFFEPTWDLPTSYRDATTPVNRNVTIGFRCARAP
jgi:formylglycine-generating enzyme required for sulfatase activity